MESGNSVAQNLGLRPIYLADNSFFTIQLLRDLGIRPAKFAGVRIVRVRLRDSLGSD